jgi:DNA-binding Xre family transcriptional regulator
LQTVERKIEEYIRENGIKKVFIYKRLGMARTTFSDKLRGKVEFTVGELIALCKLLRCEPSLFMKEEQVVQ